MSPGPRRTARRAGASTRRVLRAPRRSWCKESHFPWGSRHSGRPWRRCVEDERRLACAARRLAWYASRVFRAATTAAFAASHVEPPTSRVALYAHEGERYVRRDGLRTCREARATSRGESADVVHSSSAARPASARATAKDAARAVEVPMISASSCRDVRARTRAAGASTGSCGSWSSRAPPRRAGSPCRTCAGSPRSAASGSSRRASGRNRWCPSARAACGS